MPKARIGNLYLLLSLFFLLGPPTARSAESIQVYSQVDRNELSLSDTLTFTVSASSETSLNLDEPRLPDIAGFELLNSWSATQSQSTFSNGKFEVKQTRNFSYMLSPKSPGTLTIGAAQVVIEGKVYSTKPIQIKVSEGPSTAPQARGRGQAQPSSDDPMEEMEEVFNQLLQRRFPTPREEALNPNEAFFIDVQVDKKEAYAGEQVTASWYLYTRGQIRDIDTLKYPSVTGFWKEDIELATQLAFQQEIINGLVYRKALLASYALFPLKAGEPIVDSYKARCTVITPSNFGFGRPYQFTKVSKPIKIKVKDLPLEGKPSYFSGAVGKFQVNAELDQKSVPVNQPVTLKIRFEGQGNAKLIDLPALQLPPELELYDTQSSSKFFRDGRSYKEFQVLIIPRREGEFVLPEIKVGLFDPETKKYYDRVASEIRIQALPGDGQQTIASSPMEKSKKQEADLKETLPGLLLEWSPPQAEWKSSVGTIWVWGTAWLLTFGLLLIKASRELEWVKRDRDVVKIFKPRLHALLKLVDQNQWREVGAQGTNLIYFVLGEISGLGGAGEEFEKMLLSLPPSVRRDLGEQLRVDLRYFETLSFAPEEIVGKLNEKSQMKKRVREVESHLIKAVYLAEKRDSKEKK